MTNIIGAIFENCSNTFYGVTITQRNQADETVRCRVGHVAPIDFDAFFELTSKLTVMPIDSTFVIEAVIDDFYAVLMLGKNVIFEVKTKYLHITSLS